jgi:hypothetical protein
MLLRRDALLIRTKRDASPKTSLILFNDTHYGERGYLKTLLLLNKKATLHCCNVRYVTIIILLWQDAIK